MEAMEIGATLLQVVTSPTSIPMKGGGEGTIENENLIW